MYERVGMVSDLDSLRQAAAAANWKVVNGSGRDYLTAECPGYLRPTLWDRWHSAFFLKIPPGGRVHRHVDVDHPWNTYHVVVQTNPDCLSFTEGAAQHLESGGVYSIDRTIEHWSENNGDTDRIHLLCEVYE